MYIDCNFFQLMHMYRLHSDRLLASLPATAVAQMASIKGIIFLSDEARVAYLKHVLSGTTAAVQQCVLRLSL